MTRRLFLSYKSLSSSEILNRELHDYKGIILSNERPEIRIKTYENELNQA